MAVSSPMNKAYFLIFSKETMISTIRFSWAEADWQVQLNKPTDLALPLRPHSSAASAWHCPPVDIRPVETEHFVGSVAKGGPVNFNNISFNPHGNGCHTECFGHISPEGHSLLHYFQGYQGPALLLSITAKKQKNGDKVLLWADIEAALAPYQEHLPQALILRSMPNSSEKQSRQYTGSNPPYIETEALGFLARLDILHLLCDLPSVDREEDGGALAGHKAYWAYPHAPRYGATITEFIYVPKQVSDGLHWLNLQAAALDNDAAPSRPLVYPMERL